ncbi:MAG: MarR family winged helix-turn-helix transcriptional regulator [Ignavibacteriales bacterium]
MQLEEEIAQKHFINPYHKAVVNIIYTNNWITAFQNNLLKPYMVTVQQYNILRILRGQHPKPATIKQIKERMLDKMSDASRLVEKLRLKGLVVRNICSSDRRNVDVLITQQGLNLLTETDRHQLEMEKFMSKLRPEEIEELNYLLNKLRS